MAEAIEELIDPAEEAGDTAKILEIIATCTSHADDDDWAEPTEAALDAYYRLSKNPASGPGDVHAGRCAVSILCSCLSAWRAHEAVIEVGLGCVAALAGRIDGGEVTEVVAARYGVEDGAEVDVAGLVVVLMEAFPEEGTVQEQACLAVEGLAEGSEELREMFRMAEGVGEGLTAAVDRISNERNKSYPARAAAVLGIEL